MLPQISGITITTTYSIFMPNTIKFDKGWERIFDGRVIISSDR